MDFTTRIWLTSLWFGLTYLGLALGRIPGLRIDRAGIALVGATLIVVTGILPLPEAARAIDYETILLLFGMPQNMIIGSLSHIAYLRFAVRLAPPALMGLVVDY